MRALRTIAELDAALGQVPPGVDRGLVPTMGALHDGHRALIEAAHDECDIVVASIFVNPAQFGPREDFARYPRDEEHDLRTAEQWDVDYVFAPSEEELYPPGFETWVEVSELGRPLEGEARPGHFRGVATVCLKLFNLVRPRRAYFGQKDAQQAAIVERVVRDLNVPVEIRVVATVRDADGVALSSRNAYLSPAERAAVQAIPRALAAGAAAHRLDRDAAGAARNVLAEESLLAPEYVEVAQLNGRTYLLTAVRAGRTRLIDNVVLGGEPE